MQQSQPMARPAPPPAPSPAPPPPFNPAGALLLAGLTTALVAIGGGLFARFTPAWRPDFVTAACLLVAVEAALVRYRMLSGRHLEAGALRYLAAEFFALAVLMRVAASLSLGVESIRAQAALWLRDPLAALDPPFATCFALGLAVALIVRGGLRGLAVLEARGPAPAERGLDADFFRADLDQRERQALGRIAAGLGWGAVLALLALTVQSLSFERLGAPALPLAPAAAVGGVAYLVCAVLLYSRARLGLMRARWTRDGAAVDPAVAGRWRWGSAGLVLAVALAGLALPRGYGADLLAAAQGGLFTTVNLLSLVALFLGALAVGAIGILLTIPALILALLTGTSLGPITPAAPLPPPPVRQPPAPPGAPPIAPGIIFWACVALLAAYALWTVLRRQAWAVALARRLRDGALAPVLGWLRGLWAGASRYAHAVGEAVSERLRRPAAPPHAPRPRLRGLGPGELVRYFYRSTLARAARGGLARRRDETPYEYGAKLRARLPETADEVDQLTDAYVAAAYAPRPSSDEDARRARGWWARIRRALRGRE
jgi:hypothetical protein